jgi:hypothetical protein
MQSQAMSVFSFAWVAGIRKGPPQTPDEVFGRLETIPGSVLPGIPASDLLRAFLKGDYYATVFEAQAKGDKALDDFQKASGAGQCR